MSKKKGKVVIHSSNGSLTWKWLAGGLCTVVFVGSAWWMTSINGQIAINTIQIAEVKEKAGDQKVDQATTKQKVQDIDRKIDEVRKDVGDVKNTLQQILINQQQQQMREQQPRR